MADQPAELTLFTLDTMGRFLCNTWEEVEASLKETAGGRSRAFDVIVIGGGTFGSVITQKLIANDKWRSRRILVLEQGPFVLPEHTQNMPFGGGEPAMNIPWLADQAAHHFKGLIHAFGGRSLTWGGWSPELLHSAADDEMKGWPAAAIQGLRDEGYLLEASEQIGVSWTNDFVFGPLHEAMRKRLIAGLKSQNRPAHSMPPAALPDHPGVRVYQRKHGQALPSAEQLREWLKLPGTSTISRDDARDLLKVEAPLAVQSATDPGQFPFNKFSAIPLLIRAARVAAAEADGTGALPDARKRVMVLGNTHVQELITTTQADGWVRVTGVRAVHRGKTIEIPLAGNQEGGESVVIIALGTIESTRLALTTFKDSLAGRAAQRMGRNLMAHLRSNLNIRVRREALDVLAPADLTSLQVSALFVKGKVAVDGADRYFHLQITASGLTRLGNESEAELFKKIPDIDQLATMQQSNDTHVVITIRGIGEMTPHNPDSSISLATTPGDVDFDRPKAFVALGNSKDLQPGASKQTRDDSKIWDAMDRCADEVALLFANKMPFEILAGGQTIHVPANATAGDLKALFGYTRRRDFLGTTHHEAGTLRMSEQPADGVTNDYGRIHDTTNCYVAGPALFPTIGSPNPMLTGVALCRRTADLLTNKVLRKPPTPAVEGDFPKVLFDGTGKSFGQWQRVSPNDSNGFTLLNGEILTYGGKDFGLLYYAFERFTDFTLRLQFRVFDANANSGVFVRFADPGARPTAVIEQRM
ncbi:MAG TPA: GMC oxidoreductase, partial [Thermoanaerobaculia bacterium]|nr:GMC oxidoreductase [Thermoanaerobaculia bacterium]